MLRHLSHLLYLMSFILFQHCDDEMPMVSATTRLARSRLRRSTSPMAVGYRR